jgi:hypothetical protein
MKYFPIFLSAFVLSISLQAAEASSSLEGLIVVIGDKGCKLSQETIEEVLARNDLFPIAIEWVEERIQVRFANLEEATYLIEKGFRFEGRDYLTERFPETPEPSIIPQEVNQAAESSVIPGRYVVIVDRGRFTPDEKVIEEVLHCNYELYPLSVNDVDKKIHIAFATREEAAQVVKKGFIFRGLSHLTQIFQETSEPSIIPQELNQVAESEIISSTYVVEVDSEGHILDKETIRKTLGFYYDLSPLSITYVGEKICLAFATQEEAAHLVEKGFRFKNFDYLTEMSK